MNTQHDAHQLRLDRPDASDPLGPITLPVRIKVGARAMALVGTAGMSTFALAAATNDVSSTWPTIAA